MIHNLAHPKEKMALWPSYIFVYKYRDWPYDKKSMVDCIRSEEALQKKDIDSDIALGIKTGGIKESKFDFLDKTEKYPILEKLKEFFHEAIIDVVSHGLPSVDERFTLPIKTENLRPKIFESWYHITNNNGAHGLHCHPGASWAGIFYVQSSECKLENDNGINRWHNSNSNLGPGDIGAMWVNSNSIYRVEPEEGTLVMFPAWMWHEGTAYKGKEDRILISFNSVVGGTADDRKSEVIE